MGGERNRLAARAGFAVLLALALAGCGTVSLSSLSTNIFGTKPKANDAVAGVGGDANANADANDVECPNVSVRNGAGTLLVGSKPGETEPAALDVRYQGSLIRTARECHVNAGIMTIKVGIEGRIITGPAGGPGTVDVPMRIAVVQEGINPRTVVSKFASEQVVVNNAVDRVTFTHVDPDVSFPLPAPLAAIDSYVVYVGFDPLGAQPEKKKPRPRHKAKPGAKPSAKQKPAAARPGQG